MGESCDEDEDMVSWIQWFCSLRGNEFLCELDEEFIMDQFNLYGLSHVVPHYSKALDVILDNDSDAEDSESEDESDDLGATAPPDGGQDSKSEETSSGKEGQVPRMSAVGATSACNIDASVRAMEAERERRRKKREEVERSAELLYGLIHARYIVTPPGLNAMLSKYKRGEFGRCPRVYCRGQHVLPVGTSDQPMGIPVKLYCPRCGELYHRSFFSTPQQPCQQSQKQLARITLDGACFGTTFAHLLLIGGEAEGVPLPPPLPQPEERYVPKIYGFRIRKAAGAAQQQPQRVQHIPTPPPSPNATLQVQQQLQQLQAQAKLLPSATVPAQQLLLHQQQQSPGLFQPHR
eukprot:TRINITY_DN876_c0_g2_i1.p1 TRINITY_DN876_c0_g2~~TRINITY_DN876_c0_g2_i1.p1  ORF type:complete len:398 (+),score=125.49 TRINITY_DN876_c0_g2_i1:151-1194(+)